LYDAAEVLKAFASPLNVFKVASAFLIALLAPETLNYLAKAFPGVVVSKQSAVVPEVKSTTAAISHAVDNFY